ncbi:MAG: acyl-CoA dehydrogenase family protein, partial [Proteobacteria bacterium]|nr:acyl-CoA dehydrogenase family protein [Pseudomonadota bacterium]
MALHPYDLFDIRSLLSEEERAVQDTVARFTNERVLPIIGDAFDEARFPKELIGEIAELGLLGSSLPEEYGGGGLNAVSYGLICQELERGDSGIRSFVSVQSSLCMYPIYAYGSEEQRKRWLPGMAAGQVIGCFGLTEPHGGSDPANMKTTAKKDGGDWVINGSKMWITNGNLADIAIVWAQTDEGIQGFVVEKGMAGFAAQEIKHKMSLRASVTSSLFFDNVRVPQENLLGQRGRGYANFLHILDEGRIAISALAVGAAQGCVDESVKYAKEREAFGRPIGQNQAIAFKIARMEARVHTARTAYYDAAARLLAGLPVKKEAAIAKLVAGEALLLASSPASALREADPAHPGLAPYLRLAESVQATRGDGATTALLLASAVVRRALDVGGPVQPLLEGLRAARRQSAAALSAHARTAPAVDLLRGVVPERPHWPEVVLDGLGRLSEHG